MSGSNDSKLRDAKVNDEDVLNGNVTIASDPREKIRRSSVRNQTRTAILNEIASGIPTAANGIDRVRKKRKCNDNVHYPNR